MIQNHGTVPIWSYNPDLCHFIGIEVLSVEEAAFEWHQFIDNWANMCLFTNGDSFEVVLTDNGSASNLTYEANQGILIAYDL